jgi:hypothetical protein
MLDGLKKLLGMNEPQAARGGGGKRVTPKGETTVIVEGKRYMLKNIGMDGLMFGPAARDISPGKRLRAELIIQDGGINVRAEAVLTVAKVEGSSVDAKFYYLAPADKKQVQDYLARYS